MRRLNVKLSVSLLVGLLVLMVGVHVIHGIQVDRNADVLLAEAERAEKDSDTRLAVKKYGQYLNHRPDQVHAAERKALLAADLAQADGATSEDLKLALRSLEYAAKHTELTEVRLRLVDLLMQLGGPRFIDAIDYLNGLRTAAVASGKRDATLDVKWARCQIAVGHEEKALEVLHELVGYDDKTKEFDVDKAVAPQEIDAYLLLSDVLVRRYRKLDDAEAMMAQMVVANPDSSDAHLRYGRFEARQGHGELATDEYKRALELSPNDPVVILAMADVAITLKNFEEAQSLLDVGLKNDPTNGEIYRAMAALALAQNKLDEAIVHVLEGLKQDPKSATLMVFLVDLQLAKNDSEAVHEAIERMQKSGFKPEFILYYQGQAEVLDHKWLAASRRFEKLRPMVARNPELVIQIDLALGKCYENLGQPDRQTEAYQRVLDVQGGFIPAKLGHARGQIALGKRKEGMATIKQVDRELRRRETPIVSPEIRANLLQLAIFEQKQKPADERDWHDVDRIVDEVLADKDLSELQIGLMRAEIFTLKDEVQEADDVIEPLLKEHPEDVRVWMRWLGIQERLAAEKFSSEKHSPTDRKQVIQEAVKATLDRLAIAEKSLGDRIEIRVGRATALSRLEGDDIDEKLAAVEKGIGKFTPEEQAKFWEGMGNAYQHRRDYKNVKRCFQKLVDKRPDELFPWENMFDLAMTYKDPETAQNAAEKIAQLATRSSPSYKYCVASQMLAELYKQALDGKQLDHAQLVEARRVVEDAMRIRHDWHQLYRLEGELDDLEGRTDEAIANYQRSQELGSTNSNTARRLVILLHRQGKVQDVKAAMKHVGRANSNRDLDWISIETQFNTGEQEAALQAAADSVANNPEDIDAHVWYGQMLDKVKQPERAEEEYRAAVKKKPELASLWLLLIGQLVNEQKAAEAGVKRLTAENDEDQAAQAQAMAEKKRAEAIAALEEAKAAVPAEQLDTLLAQGNELLGDSEMAEKYQLARLEANKDNLMLRRDVALFYLRNNKVEEARAQIEAILAARQGKDDQGNIAGSQAWARRTLAEILARQGNFADIQKAIDLVQKNSPEGQGAGDLRLIARILSERSDTTSRDRAIQLFEQLESQQGLAGQERFALAGLYDRAGKWSKAREVMTSLVATNPKNTQLLGNFIQMLLQHNEVHNLDRWMEMLEESAPNAPITIQLKVRWLAQQGKTDEAVKYLEGLVPDPIEPTDVALVGMIGGMLEELKETKLAEKYLRLWYKNDPTQTVALAAFLGRIGKVDDALALFSQALQKQSFLAIGPGLFQTLRVNSDTITAKQKKTVEKWLKAAITKEPKSIPLQLLLVDYDDMNERYDDAMKHYRALIDNTDLNDNQRAVVQNNLAYLLVTRGTPADVEKAQSLVDEAIARLGPISSVLDTRGLVRLATGNAKQALDDFRTAVADAPSAVNFFHVALAEEKLGNTAGMDEAFQRAEELKLDTKQLSPGEQQSYKRLHEQLSKPDGKS
jgi:cellulose synthase operon protein C